MNSPFCLRTVGKLKYDSISSLDSGALFTLLHAHTCDNVDDIEIAFTLPQKMKVLIANSGPYGPESLTASEIARQLRDAGDEVILHRPRSISGGKRQPVTYGEAEGDIDPTEHVVDVDEVVIT